MTKPTKSESTPNDAVSGSTDSETGVVLGSMDSTPLDFWIGVADNQRVQLDDLLVVETESRKGEKVSFYGVVDIVRKRYEGGQFDSDAFHDVAGTLPVQVSYAAHVQVTRIAPEVFVPPRPGDRARLVTAEDAQRALYFDRMERKVVIGMTRGGEPIYGNLEFMDGTRGAHISISGVSGVATKTSYATFILYSLFHSPALGTDVTNSKALIFNVKGEDLLWLDRPNQRLTDEGRAVYRKLELEPGPFKDVALYAPAARGDGAPVPDTGSRLDGINPYLWTLREFAAERLLRFCFTESNDAKAQLSFVIHRLERVLENAVRTQPENDPTLTLDGRRLETFDSLVDLLDGDALDRMMTGPFTSGTLDAFRRRLHAAAARMGHLVRGNSDAKDRGIDWQKAQVTVVDIHSLHSTAQMFVVGVLLKRMMEAKESQGKSRPLVFVLLDELNKYAPREGDSPIRDVLLDIAERGRSLGISLIGAQQTASEVERRVVANCALRIVGRLDSAESERSEYGFLGKASRGRATLLQPGTMLISQPEIPVPVLATFPFPSWATRQSEAPQKSARDPYSRIKK